MNSLNLTLRDIFTFKQHQTHSFCKHSRARTNLTNCVKYDSWQHRWAFNWKYACKPYKCWTTVSYQLINFYLKTAKKNNSVWGWQYKVNKGLTTVGSTQITCPTEMNIKQWNSILTNESVRPIFTGLTCKGDRLELKCLNEDDICRITNSIKTLLYCSHKDNKKNNSDFNGG